MSAIPTGMLATRQLLSDRYLRGRGIEIGALHHPLQVSKEVQVKYVDRLSVDGLRKQYPELDKFDLVKVDVIDNGEELSKFQNNSLDFIIANHFLEHCENPLGTIRNHLQKVKEYGILYYAVPDKRQCFDRDREITSFKHLVEDDLIGPQKSRMSHLREWVELVDKETDSAEIDRRIQILDAINYSIHFHVWDPDAFKNFISEAQSYLNNSFEVKELELNENEVIVILQRIGGSKSENGDI